LKHLGVRVLKGCIELSVAPHIIFISGLDIFIVKLNISLSAYVYAVTIPL